MDHNFGLPSAFTTVHTPLPLDQRTHEGRYVWDPRLHTLPQYSGRLCGEGSVNSLPDFSHFSQRRDFANGHVDYSPHLRLSPFMVASLHGSPTFSTAGVGPAVDTRVPLSMDALQQMSVLHQRTSFPVTTGVPQDLAMSLEGSQVTSPKMPGRHGRKRALSSSPYSDFDITSVIRFSPNSLVSFMNGSRSSSESGSYGHLSAGSLSPAMGVSPPAVLPHFHQLHHLMRQGLTSPFLLHPASTLPQQPVFSGATSATKDVVTRSGEATPQPKASERADDDKETAADEPGDFVETNCHWKECSREFSTQDELVKHINNDHIHGNKKAFVCRWTDCCREEKPFKAQYMLVVHMRRHTGEKPHTCTFEGCLKAYSRLENLKTHLRSHTGEKPYLCEFPGCTKAFSNASDRAKHQNRTHSNEKPYVCKAPGCTKRYTDPSSLRKHVKTVHGPDFYAKKKHKGDETEGSKEEKHSDSVPPSEDTWGRENQSSHGVIPATQDSSQLDNTPGNDVPRFPEIVEDGPVLLPISDNCVSTTSGFVVGSEADSCWENEEVDVAKIEGSTETVMCLLTHGRDEDSPRGWTRSIAYSPLKAKGSWLPRVMAARDGVRKNAPNQTSGDLSYITDQQDGGNDTKTYIDLSFPVDRCASPQYTTPDNRQRRNSSTSNTSTFYGSMTSDASRGSSRRDSHVSHSLQSFSDPISMGSSRRSSGVSSLSGLSSNAASRLLSLHSQALSTPTSSHSKAPSETNSCCDKQTVPRELLSSQGSNGRLKPNEPSKPEKYSQDSSSLDGTSDKDYTVQLTSLPPINPSRNCPAGNNWKHHPNEDVPLETCELIEENKDLVLPDEMMYYLNKVTGGSNEEERLQGNMTLQQEIPTATNEIYKENTHHTSRSAHLNNQCNSQYYVRNTRPAQNRTVIPGQSHTGFHRNHINQPVHLMQTQTVNCHPQATTRSCHNIPSQSSSHQTQFYPPSYPAVDVKHSSHSSGDMTQNRACSSYSVVPNNFRCHQQYYNTGSNSPRQQLIPNMQRLKRSVLQNGREDIAHYFTKTNCSHLYGNSQSSFQGNSQFLYSNRRYGMCSSSNSPQSCTAQYNSTHVPCCNCSCATHQCHSTTPSQLWPPGYQETSLVENPTTSSNHHCFQQSGPGNKDSDIFPPSANFLPRTALCNHSGANHHWQQENIAGVSQVGYQSQPATTNASFSRNQPQYQVPLMSTTNMVINDMNSTLSSLMEETRYLELLK